MSKATNWIDIGEIADVPVRGSRLVQVQGGAIAIFRTRDDQVFALDDRCPHLGGPLSQGIVHDRSVTCPLHNLVIDLKSGEGQGPDGGCVRSYPVELRDARIFLDLGALENERVA